MELLLKVNTKIDDIMIEELISKNVKIKDAFELFGVVFVEIENIKALNQFNFVEYYEPEEFFHVQNIHTIPNIRINKLKTHNYVGNNAVVAVIDSGMDPDGLDIFRSEIFSVSATPNDARYKGELHGTVVGKTIKHIAPWSRIVNLKVMGDNSDITKSSILKALTFVYNNNIRIVNMSLSKKGQCSDKCIVCSAVNQLVDGGFTIVTSIGNWGPGNTGCPGNAKKVLTVGAVNASKQLADYSGTASDGTFKPDILGPGCVTVNGKPYDGTSIAAPIITGITAALSNNFELGHIIESMKNTAVSIGLPHNLQGHGLIHIERLLGVLQNEKSAN